MAVLCLLEFKLRSSDLAAFTYRVISLESSHVILKVDLLYLK